jgi:hypothetical protein
MSGNSRREIRRRFWSLLSEAPHVHAGLRGALCVLALICAGCAAEHILTYAPMSDQAALQVMAARAKSVKSVSAQGTITLSRSGRDGVRLDAAIVLSLPDRARLRAWKLGHAVLDMTLTPEGMWLIEPAPPAGAPSGADAIASPAKQDGPGAPTTRSDVPGHGQAIAAFARRLLGAMGGFFQENPSSMEQAGGKLHITQSLPDGMTLRCEVDPSTLTARRFRLLDPHGAQRFEIVLDRYAMVDGIAWPRRIEATGPSGRILIDLGDVEINGAVSPAAFIPPARARRIDLPAEVRP